VQDVALLLEGTFPFVSGGVSTWVYQLIESMPHFAFSCFYLGPTRPKRRRLYYPIPRNVTDFREFYLFDFDVHRSLTTRLSKIDADLIYEFIVRAESGDISLFGEIVDLFSPDKGRLSVADLAYSKRGYEMLERLYERLDSPPSMLDFFWTWRVIYLTFFSLIGTPLPKASLYHTISTGYAGVLGALAKHRSGRPLLLTEHGIYNRERRIEISQADWIYSESAGSLLLREGQVDVVRRWWNQIFRFFGLLAYHYADEIVTLSRYNRELQIAEGGDPSKIRIVPNGVDETRIGSIAALDKRWRIAMIGRVVPIKDVKTFIRASRIVADAFPTIDILIVGPTDEDEEYFEECVELVENEGLTDIVRFLGQQEMSAIYPTLDLIVLTSHSEGQPLVILEGGMYGIPTIATSVGACREMIEGREGADRLLGPGGVVTGLCNPQETAESIVHLLGDDALRRQMGEAARKRVENSYRRDFLIASYGQLYTRYMERARWQG